ncbi:MAG: hypothetical protein QM784_13775 [Polyangiaceae bacterium]
MSIRKAFNWVGASWQTVLSVTTLTAALGSAIPGCGANHDRQASWPGTTETYPADAENGAATAPKEREAVQPRVFEPSWLAELVTTTDQPQISQGHQPPTHRIEVLITPSAAQTYRTWSRDSTLPVGTWLVARHLTNPEQAEPTREPTEALPLYYMRLTDNGWQYGAATHDGRPIPVAREVCQDCHTQARSQSVFGPPQRR